MESSAAAAAAAVACAVAGVVVGRRVRRSRKWRRAMMEDLRAADFYLAVGEIDDASRYYMKSMQVGSEVCVDKKIAVEASEGIRKAQKVSECMNRAAELLLAKAPKDVETAVELIAEALTISLYSEKLLEMKAEALFMLGRYEEVVQLCEQTLDSAEKNPTPLNKKEECADTDGFAFSKTSYFRGWRGHQMFKSYFRLGRLEEGLVSLEGQEELWSATNRLQVMRHFRLEGMQRQSGITLPPCHATWNRVLSQLYVFAIVLLHTRRWAKLLMLLLIVALP